MAKKKMALAVTMVGAIGLFFYLGGHQFLQLDVVKDRFESWQAWTETNLVTSSAVFFGSYVIITALSLPGAAVLTLLGGALFGLGYGLLLVSFASTLGALGAFLAARYLFSDTVNERFGDRLKPIADGIKRQGSFYLFSLRLVPVFPFFLINLVMGLLPMRPWTFYWVSQLGMLPGTFVYVNAGGALGQIDSLSGLVSLEVLGAFGLLAVLPFIGKLIVQTIERNRLYRQWSRPKHFDRNIIVIGAGAGGLVSAYIAAAVKARVTLIEAHKMGGDCLNFGCVPSKALIRRARQHYEARKIGAETPASGFSEAIKHVQNSIKAIEPHDSIERYTQLGVEVRQGYAKLIDPWTVEISDSNSPTAKLERLTGRNIIIATGARPYVPTLPGLDSVPFATSDTLWETLSKRDTAPSSLLVMGGGPIGCEIAQALARLGSSVTLVEKNSRLLFREDPECGELIQKSLERDGVKVITEHEAWSFEPIESSRGRAQIRGVKNQEAQSIDFDLVLVAIGRQARLEGYGLEELGIETGRTITTNTYMQTSIPNIYAVGDVTGPFQLTHAAAHQAWFAAVNSLFGTFKRFKADYRVLPAVTYTHPECARVGLSELEAQRDKIPFEVTRYEIAELDRAICEDETDGFVKILTPPGKDRILGATVVGDHAGEVLAEITLAMKYGLGLNKILGTVHPYPTWAESAKYAAGEWKRAHAPQGLLKLVARYHKFRLKH